MQRSVFESWISGLVERGFDAPLLALLRSHGYYDIHFTHGQYEFGKDFLAKRLEDGKTVQYAFQSKAGDIGGPDWDSIFAQLFEAAGGRLTHPNFDASAPRCCVLVTTGRLKGKAIQSAKDFMVRVAAEATFVVWDQDYLLDLARGTNPDFPLRDPHPAIEKLVAEIQLGMLGGRSLMLGLESAIPALPLSGEQLHTTSMDATLVIAALRRAGLHLHVPLVAAHLARLASATSDPALAARAYEESMLIYRAGVDALAGQFLGALDSPSAFCEVIGNTIDVWFTYPAACLLLGEFITTALFHARRAGDSDGADRYGAVLRRLVRSQPGIAHPVSDRYAVSTFAICAGLASLGATDELRALVIGTTRWLCDRLDKGSAGLASPYADPKQEIEQLFGARLECVDIERNAESWLALALLEAANAWIPDLYPDVLNDLLAVEAIPDAVIPVQLPEGLFLNRGGTKSLINPDFPPAAGPSPWHVHEAWTLPAPIATAAEAPLVFATACRDRLFQAATIRAVQVVLSGSSSPFHAAPSPAGGPPAPKS